MRAYDPTLGRFISRDPLGRAPLFFAGQPYVYAGNNPETNVDPSGQIQIPAWLQGVVTLLISSGVSLWQMMKSRSAQGAEYAVLERIEHSITQLRHLGKSSAQVWKSMAFRRGSQLLEKTLGKIRFWENVGKAIWLIGGAIDWFTVTWTVFHSNMRPDLAGWTRFAVAVVAGLLHAAFVTIVGWGSTAALTFFFGPWVGWAGGAILGYLAGLLAD